MVSFLHVLDQGPMIRALGGVALTALSRPRPAAAAPVTPGPWIEAELPPRPDRLVLDYIAHVGGRTNRYRWDASGAPRLPPHLFPQWGFPILLRTLAGLPYPYARAVNAGCRIEVGGPLLAREPLLVRARLESVDDDGRRAIITQRLVTGTRSVPEAITADVRVLVPLGKKGVRGAPRARTVVPESAKPIATLDLDARAGLDFALLTGDFNPIHWVRPYAKVAGFPSTILHGFATLARAYEALCNGFMDGPLRSIDVRFTRPLVLPARASVYTSAHGELWVGDAVGGEAYLEGRFETASG